MNTEMIAVTNIHLDPAQPREIYTGIESLAESMRNAGFMPDQAISVWHSEELPENEYQVIDGHRRTKAAKMVSLADIPCFVYEGISKRDVWEKQLIANSNREDLSIMNKARSFQRSIDEHGMSIARIAKIHGITVQTARADLELLNLADKLQTLVDAGVLPKEVARKIASLESKQQQVHAWEHASDKRNVKGMLAAIEAYLGKDSQGSLFKQAAKDAAETGGMKKARIVVLKLQRAAVAYEKDGYGNLNVINSRKREKGELNLLGKQLKRLGENLCDMVAKYDAETEVNAPVQAVNA